MRHHLVWCVQACCVPSCNFIKQFCLDVSERLNCLLFHEFQLHLCFWSFNVQTPSILQWIRNQIHQRPFLALWLLFVVARNASAPRGCEHWKLHITSPSLRPTQNPASLKNSSSLCCSSNCFCAFKVMEAAPKSQTIKTHRSFHRFAESSAWLDLSDSCWSRPSFLCICCKETLASAGHFLGNRKQLHKRYQSQYLYLRRGGWRGHLSPPLHPQTNNKSTPQYPKQLQKLETQTIWETRQHKIEKADTSSQDQLENKRKTGPARRTQHSRQGRHTKKALRNSNSKLFGEKLQIFSMYSWIVLTCNQSCFPVCPIVHNFFRLSTNRLLTLETACFFSPEA